MATDTIVGLVPTKRRTQFNYTIKTRYIYILHLLFRDQIANIEKWKLFGFCAVPAVLTAGYRTDEIIKFAASVFCRIKAVVPV